jgi:uncharacterized protein with beta-barrel porin domain
LSAALLTLASTSVCAQTQLGNVVQQGGGTQLQIDSGNAVQRVCGNLGAANGGALNNIRLDVRAPTSRQEDLYFRCNEMVNTANSIAGSGEPNNSLGLNSSQLAVAMQQLSGEENGSKTRLATETSNGQFANIGLRLDALARGARATTGALTTAGRDGGQLGGNAGDPGDGGGWGWFATGAVGSGDRDSTARENEYDYDSSGLTFGADRQLSGGAVIGAAIGIANFEVDFADLSAGTLASTVAGGGIEVDGYSLSFYGLAQPGERLTIDGVLIYGTNDYDTTRRVAYQADTDAAGRGAAFGTVNRTIIGQTDGSQWAAGINVGTSFEWGATTLYLDGGFTHLDVGVDGYDELDTAVNGGLGLRYDEQDITSTQARVGLHLTRAFSRTSSVISPFVNLELRHELENDAEVLGARYIYAASTAPNLDLAFQTDEPEEDFVEAGIGVLFVLKNNFQLIVDYRTELGLDLVSADLLAFSFRGGF